MTKNWLKIGSVFAFALVAYSVLQTSAGSSAAVAGGMKDDCPVITVPLAVATGTDDAEDRCDVTSPSVLSISRSGTDGSSVGACGPETITITLSEPSIDFVAGDVSLSVGALTDWNATSATVYTAVFTPPANSTGSATISIAVGAFTDSCNSSKQNVNTGEQFDFIEIAYDTQVVSEPTPTTIPTPTPIEPGLLASPAPTATIAPAPPIALPTRGAAPAKTKVFARVFFGLRSSFLTEDAKTALKTAVLKVPKNKNFSVVVVGMVQDSENVANIEPLSSRRAEVVRAYLRTLGIKGQYEVRIGGVVGKTPTARRATASIFYS
jgi:outer membrane protein OmpA-like peptidoglycan-associated protein